MLNIQDYQRYSGEKKIALMDNSTVSFLEQVERAGISTKELLKDYDAILIPNWVSEEICDSIYRKDYIERLYAAGLPIITDLFQRRNAIAHQNDRSHASAEQNDITKEFVEDYMSKIKTIVNAIHSLAEDKEPHP